MTVTDDLQLPSLWTPPDGPWLMQAPLWRRPPPLQVGWWPRLLWRLRRGSAGTLLIDGDQLQWRVNDKPMGAIRWDAPFALHLSRHPIDGVFAEIGFHLRQSAYSADQAVGFRALVLAAHLDKELPHKQESSGYLSGDDLKRLWPILSFYADAHGVEGWDRLSLDRTARAPAGAALAHQADIVALAGRGLRGIEVGRSTFIEALAEFGADCQINCYTHGPTSGTRFDARRPGYKVWSLSYSYNADLNWDSDRPANHARPSGVDCDPDTGIITKLQFGVYQNRIVLDSGLRQGDTLADVLRIYGEDAHKELIHPLDVYTYPGRGVIFWIDPKTNTINSFYIVPIKEEPQSQR